MYLKFSGSVHQPRVCSFASTPHHLVRLAVVFFHPFMASILMWLGKEAFANILHEHGGREEDEARRVWDHTHGLMEDLNTERIRTSRDPASFGEVQIRFAFLITKSRPPVPLWLTLAKFLALCEEHSHYDVETAERTYKHSAGMLLAHEPNRVRVHVPPPGPVPQGLCHNPAWPGWKCEQCGETTPMPIVRVLPPDCVDDPMVLPEIEVQFYMRFL